jgi:hypothetical protein
MNRSFGQTIRCLALGITTTVLVNGFSVQLSQARPVDLDTLCQKFPLNSRCANYRYPLHTAQESADVKLRLKTSGPDNEWIRIERQEEREGERVKLIHTTRDRTTASKVFNGVLGAVSPIPIPNIDSHKWYDHPTTRVVFVPDSCSIAQQFNPASNSNIQSDRLQSSSCSVAGTDSVTLARGTDIYKGRFTIEYQEGDLLRSITFRVPNDAK